MTRPILSHILVTAFSATLALAPAALRADMVDIAIDSHILPGFHRLADRSRVLSETANRDCDANSVDLRAAYGTAFDAWVRVSHLRFGPTETDNRAFALAFWPDSRGKTPKALNALIRKNDPIIDDPEAYTAVSIAARGFYALEFLLFDAPLQQAGTDTYRCALTRTIARDIAATSAAIDKDWSERFAEEMRQPGARYQSEAEIRQELFKALDTGLQILVDMRLGRPLGTYDKPRPKRAEAYRSGRSLRHVVLSLEALADLAMILSADTPDLGDDLAKAFATVRAHAERLEDPVFAGVAAPGPRLRIEALQQDIRNLREEIGLTLGPALGVGVGFNALDGD